MFFFLLFYGKALIICLDKCISICLGSTYNTQFLWVIMSKNTFIYAWISTSSQISQLNFCRVIWTVKSTTADVTKTNINNRFLHDPLFSHSFQICLRRRGHFCSPFIVANVQSLFSLTSDVFYCGITIYWLIICCVYI